MAKKERLLLEKGERVEYKRLQREEKRERQQETLAKMRSSVSAKRPIVRFIKAGSRLGRGAIEGRKSMLSYSKGLRGRPPKSYDKRYAKFGGVYSFRKIQAAQLAQERMEAMRQATVTPEQQVLINQFEARRRARMGTPFGWESVNVANDIEKEVSSTGMGSIQDEINKYCQEIP